MKWLLWIALALVGCGGAEGVCAEDSDCAEGESCAVNVITGRSACLERCHETMTCSDGGMCVEYPPKERSVEGVLYLCGRP